MDWQEIDTAIDQLADNIGEAPDAIVGIVRGGIVPARLLAARLDVKTMYCLTVKKVAGEREVVTEITDDLKGMKVLLVEDVLETGLSLQIAKDYLESLGVRVSTVAMFTLAGSVTPDYSLREVPTVPNLPWE